MPSQKRIDRASRGARHRSIRKLAKARNVRYGLVDLCFEKGWRCHLCGLSIPEDWGPHDPWRPTRDHVLPEVHGGSRAHANIELAHAYCNSRRGDSLVGAVDLPALRRSILERAERWPVELA